MHSLDCIQVCSSLNWMDYYNVTTICPVFMSETVTFFIVCILGISYSFYSPTPHDLYIFISIIFQFFPVFLFSLGTIFP